uniref:Uncharacterized protein n=1 Tax=Lepeophtheirus salmonis TaxID=72036 RepID=A0A0K2T8E1_LEPSM
MVILSIKPREELTIWTLDITILNPKYRNHISSQLKICSCQESDSIVCRMSKINSIFINRTKKTTAKRRRKLFK